MGSGTRASDDAKRKHGVSLSETRIYNRSTITNSNELSYREHFVGVEFLP
jgi:hypothetical protein